MNVLPAIIRALDVEMIRDGGSFAATFEDKGGHRHILFTKIEVATDNNFRMVRVGYKQPVLIDCDPAKRPKNTARRIYSELGGPSVPVTWDQARTLMALTTPLGDKLSEWRCEWLRCMGYVVANDGAVPPSMQTPMQTF